MQAVQGQRVLAVIGPVNTHQPAAAAHIARNVLAIQQQPLGFCRRHSHRGDTVILSAAAAEAPPKPPTSLVENIKTAKLASGHSIPLIGFGTFGVPPEKTADAVRGALEAGYRHIDTAVVYQNEAQVGEAVNEWLKAGKGKREDLFIVTKIWSDQKSREGAEAAVRTSLKALGLDYIDLVLIHWPVTDQPGGAIVPSPQETWEGLSAAVDQGLVKSIGVSNHSPEKIHAWFQKVRVPVSVNQVESHPQFRNDHVVEACTAKGIHVTAYAPLSSPGQMESMGIADKVPNLLQEKVVTDIASKLDKTPSQVLLAWGMRRGISVIPKASDLKHAQENLGAVGWDLPEEDFKTLSSLSPQTRYFVGAGLGFSDDGPWRSYEALWDEPQPATP